MDSMQPIQVGPRFCAVVLSVTMGTMSPALLAAHRSDFSDAAKAAYAAAAQSAYTVPGLQVGSQSTQRVIPAVGSDDFFQNFGKNFDSKQVSLSSADHQLIWDNLDYLLS